jgi:hypothetical protein
VANVEWGIQPSVEDATTQHEIAADRTQEFFEGDFNANNEAFDHLLKRWTNDIVSIDTGTLEKVPTQTKIDGTHWLSEIYYLDGMVMTKNLDARDRIPNPPDPAYYKYGNLPQVRENILEMNTIDDILTHQNILRMRGMRGKETIPFNRDEVIWVERNPRPQELSPYGFGITQQVRKWAEILLNQDTANIKHFSDDEYAKGILAIGAENQNEVDRFREYWKDEIKGHTDTNMPIVGGGGDNEFIPFNETLKELQYLESQQWYNRLVWYLFGLNESEIGSSGEVNRSTAREHSIQVWRQTTKPLLQTIEVAINNNWLPAMRQYDLVDGEIEFSFNLEHPEVEARERERRRDDLEKGITTPNEVREEEGKDPKPWGDMPDVAVNAFAREHPEWVAEEWGGLEDVPEPSSDDMGGLFSHEPVETDTVGPGPEESAEMNTDAKEVFPDEGKPFAGYEDFDECVTDNQDKDDPEAYCGWLEEQAKGNGNSLKDALQTTHKDDESLRNTHEDFPHLKQYVEAGEKAIGEAIQEAFSQLEDELDERWPEVEDKGTTPDSQKFELTPGWIKDTIDIQDALASAITGVVGEAMQESAEHHESRLDDTVESLIEDIPDAEVDISFDVRDTFAFDRMVQSAAQDMVTVEQTVKDRVQDTLVNVAEDGGNVGDATRELRDEIDELSDSHARLVARTEVLDAGRHGSQALAESADLIQGKEWNATDDSRTRPWHDAMDGEIVRTEDNFVVPSGWEGEPHYQPSDYPRTAYVVGDEQVYNCRCDQRPVLGDSMPDELRSFEELHETLGQYDCVEIKTPLTERQQELWDKHCAPGETFEAWFTKELGNHGVTKFAKKYASNKTVYSWKDQFGLE